MVKIVQANDHKAETRRAATCTCCKSKLEYGESDLAYWPWADYSGDTSDVYFITCPQCQASVKIGHDLQLSSYWREQARLRAIKLQEKGLKPKSHWGDHY